MGTELCASNALADIPAPDWPISTLRAPDLREKPLEPGGTSQRRRQFNGVRRGDRARVMVVRTVKFCGSVLRAVDRGM